VAKRLNVHPASVSNWYRQPWFQEFMLEEMQLTGVEPIKALIAGAAHDSVLTLIELRDDEKVPASVRKQAASDLLDRAYGKAPTVVRHESNGLDATKSMEALDREIKELLGQNENRVSLAQ
jgi:Asp-tRNA(Asn)/Glu-tRNA(Gln) amidotransferase B subunit